MVLYQLIWLAFGAGLAQRFKFMILGPATVIVLFEAVSLGVAQSDTLSRTILLAVTGAVSLQVGYFVGLGMRTLSKPKTSAAPQSFGSHPSSARHSAS